MRVDELLRDISYTWLTKKPDAEVTGISHDTRTVKPGDAFICVKGARFDTHEAVNEIAAAGAVLLILDHEVSIPEGCAAVLVEDTRAVTSALAAAFYGHPAERLVTIGITGSKGKTTTTHMMADILRHAGFLTGTIGTNGAIMPKTTKSLQSFGEGNALDAIDCAETPGYNCYELANTTPDAMELQMYLAMMVQSGCTHAVIEVSSQAMKQHRVDGFTFDYGIWTNIETGDHIGPNEHKDFEEYISCKADLLNHSRIGFMNADDTYADKFRSHVHLSDGTDGTAKALFTFGRSANADCTGKHLEKTFDPKQNLPGIAFDFTDHKSQLPTRRILVNLPGEFNMYNAMAAVCVADCLGISDECINEALTNLKIRGRFDLVFDNEDIRVCVDFAHNGYSTRNHLQALREYQPRRIVCVFGADGNRSRYRRYEMGEASAKYADLSIVTSGHNRWETFETICADILQGIEKAEKELEHKTDWMVIPDRKKAIRFAIEHAQPGDMITILGLGHENYQEENGVKSPYSDIAYAGDLCRELLEE